MESRRPMVSAFLAAATVSIPDQGPNFFARTLFLQVWARDGQGGVVLGSFSALTVLDPVY